MVHNMSKYVKFSHCPLAPLDYLWRNIDVNDKETETVNNISSSVFICLYFLINLTCTVPVMTRFPDLFRPCPAQSEPQHFCLCLLSSLQCYFYHSSHPFSPISTCMHFCISCPHPLLPWTIESSTFSISLSTASNPVLSTSTAARASSMLCL